MHPFHTTPGLAAAHGPRVAAKAKVPSSLPITAGSASGGLVERAAAKVAAAADRVQRPEPSEHYARGYEAAKKRFAAQPKLKKPAPVKAAAYKAPQLAQFRTGVRAPRRAPAPTMPSPPAAQQQPAPSTTHSKRVTDT